MRIEQGNIIRPPSNNQWRGSNYFGGMYAQNSSEPEGPLKWFCKGCGLSWAWWTMTAAFIVLATVNCFVYANGTFILFVVVGWIVSLTLHEFAHAMVAYKGGDHSVEEKGYLTLDVTRYTDPVMTFAVPLAMLMLGGVPLPGGAVSIMTSQLHSRKWITFVSLAGPLANFLFGGLMALWLHSIHLIATLTENQWFESIYSGYLGQGIALIAYFQVMATLLNLLPLPPLDGWGALSPWFGQDCFLNRWMSNPTRSTTVTLISFLFIWVVIAKSPFFHTMVPALSKLYGLDPMLVAGGQKIFSQIRLI
eukprot:Selendium_serpulae@DN5531_c0_g2_i3.p2